MTVHTCPQALLLDTHIALWLDNGDTQLTAHTIEEIDRVRRSGGTVYLSAVSAWEIALLVEAGGIQLDLPVARWLERFFSQSGVEPMALSTIAAAGAYGFYPLPHRDPADLLLMSSAVTLACPLVTYDRRILDFGRARGSQFGLRVLGPAQGDMSQ